MIDTTNRMNPAVWVLHPSIPANVTVLSAAHAIAVSRHLSGLCCQQEGALLGKGG